MMYWSPRKKNAYAVGLFNAVNLELARGIIAAAERVGSPVIMGTAEVLLPFGPLEELSYFLVPMAKKSRVPVVIHYDHGLTAEKCVEALKLGFSSIMYDCSTDSYEDNVRKTKEMAYIAHCFGATIEAELGHVGDAEGSAEGSSHLADPAAFYTDPDQAVDFVSRTGVDALAIAVGTAHGHYKAKPKLDFDRIAKIGSLIPCPLVPPRRLGSFRRGFPHRNCARHRQDQHLYRYQHRSGGRGGLCDPGGKNRDDGFDPLRS